MRCGSSAATGLIRTAVGTGKAGAGGDDGPGRLAALERAEAPLRRAPAGMSSLPTRRTTRSAATGRATA